MRCDHAHDDAAFLLGSLSTAERVAYERHLRECADCAASVRDLAGLPGLLGRVPPEVLQPTGDAHPPDTLLPALQAEVRRARRRTVRAVAGAVAAAVVAIAGVIGVLTLAGDDGTPAAAPTAPAQQMEPVGGSAVTGWVSLTAVPWGTRIDLTCTYESTGGIGGRYDDRDSGATTYAMVVHTTDGRTQSAGTWRAEDGRETHVRLATDAAPGDIAWVEVTTADGDSVLRLRSPAQ